jgi:hypothetical protein
MIQNQSILGLAHVDINYNFHPISFQFLNFMLLNLRKKIVVEIIVENCTGVVSTFVYK